MRRTFPGRDPRAAVVYSQDIHSFGVRPPPAVPSLQLTARTPASSSVTLTDLPVELLQLVFTYLDSWSLSNLALVSVRLRHLVASLLDEKVNLSPMSLNIFKNFKYFQGCVALQWERVEDEGVGTSGWVVAYRRWFFSSHFTPVDTWGLNHADGIISQHLDTCPYNVRTVHTKPDTRGKQWTDFMAALKQRMKQKRDSEWFIE